MRTMHKPLLKAADAHQSAENIDRLVGSRLKARRSLLGLTQEQLAGECGLTFQQIDKYEAGLSRMSASRLVPSARLLEVRVGWFFDDVGEVQTTGPKSGRREAQCDASRLLLLFAKIKSAKRRAMLMEFAQLLSEE